MPANEPADLIYSSADADVEPPVLVQPKRNIRPPADGPTEDLTVLDLLISDAGRVETVRLATRAQDYREAMLFSVVKTWKFKPATKAGRPVRYLKRVWIPISPIGTTIR